MTARHLACALVVVGATSALAACGNRAPNTTPALDAAVQVELRQDLQSVAAALAAKQPARAQTALQVMDADVAAAYTAGKISNAKLAQIRTAATELALDVQRLANPPAPTITMTTHPTTSSASKAATNAAVKTAPTHAAPKPPAPAPPPHHKGHKDAGDG
jgi:hypothetical protein